MTFERQVYVYLQLPGTLTTIPAALLKVQTLPDGSLVGRFRYGDRYLRRHDAVALDPFQLPLDKTVFEFTQHQGIPSAVRDSAPDAWGRRVIEHQLERSAQELHEIDYLLHGPQDGAGCLIFGLNAAPPAPQRPYNRTYQLSGLIAATQAIESGQSTEGLAIAGLPQCFNPRPPFLAGESLIEIDENLCRAVSIHALHFWRANRDTLARLSAGANVSIHALHFWRANPLAGNPLIKIKFPASRRELYRI